MIKLFEIHQRITLMVNEYAILKDGQVVGFAKQKRMALREQFTIYSDESQKEVLATSKARGIMDVSPTFDIYDKNQKPLAVFKKEFAKSLLASTWSVYDAGGKKLIFNVSEKSKLVAIFRRVWELVPGLPDLIPFPFRFHCSIKAGNKVAGEYLKTTTIRDHYALFLEEDYVGKLDERAWMVMAVLLDAMQSR